MILADHYTQNRSPCADLSDAAGAGAISRPTGHPRTQDGRRYPQQNSNLPTAHQPAGLLLVMLQAVQASKDSRASLLQTKRLRRGAFAQHLPVADAEASAAGQKQPSVASLVDAVYKAAGNPGVRLGAVRSLRRLLSTGVGSKLTIARLFLMRSVAKIVLLTNATFIKLMQSSNAYAVVHICR